MSYGLAIFLLYTFVFLFGAVIASFLNVVIYRLPRSISVAAGRSFCPQCGHVLRPYDMLPVLSWFILKGKCRFCGQPIAKRYPLVEFLGGIIAVAAFGVWGFTLYAVAVAGIGLVCLALAFIDWDTMTVPNSLLAALMVIGIFAALVNEEFQWLAALIGLFSVSVPLFLITLFVPGAFGGGDILFMAVMGFILGWRLTLVGAFLGIVLGGAYGVYLLCRSADNRKKHFPFLPFLATGAYIVLLWGDNLLNWYLSLF